MERVGGDQGLEELADHLAVPPGRQVGVDTRLDRREPQAVETDHLGLHVVDLVEVRVGPAPPQPQCLVQVRGRPRGVAQGQRLLPGADSSSKRSTSTLDRGRSRR